LSWKLHINSLIRRLASVAYAIRSLKHILLKEAIKLYISAKLSGLYVMGLFLGGQSPEASKVFLYRKRYLELFTT
jgi:hypothetical protein